jgi:hypothetical protein
MIGNDEAHEIVGFILGVTVLHVSIEEMVEGILEIDREYEDKEE